mgnify:CR=1 FL=1
MCSSDLRTGDIPLLLDAFLKRFNTLFDKDIQVLSPECLNALESYHWPGNIRELKNVIQRAVLICPGKTLRAAHLPARFEFVDRKPSVSFEIGTSLSDMERDMIVHTLQFTHNNRLQAARLLGISRRTLYNKIARYNLD